MDLANFVEELIHKATDDDDDWLFANEVLYNLCKEHPSHDDVSKIIAKIWLIGRSYAAPIERGRASLGSSEDFYTNSVGPVLRDSEIDKLICEAKGKTPDEFSLQQLIDAHGALTETFKKISNMNNRSLASKYLHFHLPEFVYIYDSRANVAIKKLNKMFGVPERKFEGGDAEYRCFSEKCLNVQTQIDRSYGVTLTPRKLDNLLLAIENADGH
jgi:hypothetical protein